MKLSPAYASLSRLKSSTFFVDYTEITAATFFFARKATESTFREREKNVYYNI